MTGHFPQPIVDLIRCPEDSANQSQRWSPLCSPEEYCHLRGPLQHLLVDHGGSVSSSSSSAAICPAAQPPANADEESQ